MTILKCCITEFINPYGIHSSSQTHKDSESSSDRLSQFGTARDYHDFDMQNEPYWYNEKDDDDFMTPNFEWPESFGCQSEDKFIMTSGMENQHENLLENNYKGEVFQVEGNGDCMDKLCLYNHSDAKIESVTYLKDFSHIGKKELLEGGLLKEVENHTYVYTCEIPFSKPVAGSGESCSGDPSNGDRCPSLKEIHLNDLHLKVVGDNFSIDSDPEHSMNQTFDLYLNGNSNKGLKAPYDLTIEVAETDLPSGPANYKAQECGEFTEECQDPENAADGEDANTDDELLKYTHEDEYEVFDLRVIHRKNRFVSDC